MSDEIGIHDNMDWKEILQASFLDMYIQHRAFFKTWDKLRDMEIRRKLDPHLNTIPQVSSIWAEPNSIGQERAKSFSIWL